jgi:threonine dehydratase
MIGSADDYAKVDQLLELRGVTAADVSTEEIVGYRIINYEPELFTFPLFVNVEFPERAGAFQQFMEKVSEFASLCYFNYEYSGERVGRALVGMDFENEAAKESCTALLAKMVGGDIRDVRPVSDETLKRLLG